MDNETEKPMFCDQEFYAWLMDVIKRRLGELWVADYADDVCPGKMIPAKRVSSLRDQLLLRPLELAVARRFFKGHMMLADGLPLHELRTSQTFCRDKCQFGDGGKPCPLPGLCMSRLVYVCDDRVKPRDLLADGRVQLLIGLDKFS